ncbi:hat family dimerization domaincontaining protein-related [Holotrichia oblita]|uniref:Hat family dimerization domaincontaining protein-related n=1 Tax=Holotrichia oblita TaxID=644536 RepID=A0ACB9T3W5_HOLOL|nr:hat family dimerization domaincontaining protein-related [Holotrichia oblita]
MVKTCGRAKCIACETEFQADITVLRNHSKGAKHLKNVKKIAENPPKIATAFKRNEAQDEVNRAELKITALITDHNLPVKICDHLIPLLKDTFPDSKIAQGMKMGRSKATEVL